MGPLLAPLLQLPLQQREQILTCLLASWCAGRPRDPLPFAVVWKNTRNDGAVAVVDAVDVAGIDSLGRIFVVT